MMIPRFPMRVRKRFVNFKIILASCILCLGSWIQPVCAIDYIKESNPNELESNAKYNYYIGQYYYTQGRFSDAEQYFERSRDMIERKNSINSVPKKGGVASSKKLVPGSTGGLEYTVGEGDVLFITVWQNEDLNQEVIVRPDGMISFPLVGDVAAAGMSIKQIDDTLTSRLKEYLKFPDVSISIRKIGGSKVVILGQVRSPGVYAVSGKASILEAIAMAGGLTRDAVGTSVVLIRGGLQNPHAEKVNVAKAQKGEFARNIILQPEDIIFVPSSTISDVGYVIAQVIDPMSRGAMAADIMRKWQPH